MCVYACVAAPYEHALHYFRRLLGLDLVPRVEGEMADVEHISPVELFNIHEQSTVNSQEASVSTQPAPLFAYCPLCAPPPFICMVLTLLNTYLAVKQGLLEDGGVQGFFLIV